MLNQRPKVSLEVLGLVEGEQVLARVVERARGVGPEGHVLDLVARDGFVFAVDEQLGATQLRLRALGAREVLQF